MAARFVVFFVVRTRNERHVFEGRILLKTGFAVSVNMLGKEKDEDEGTAATFGAAAAPHDTKKTSRSQRDIVGGGRDVSTFQEVLSRATRRSPCFDRRKIQEVSPTETPRQQRNDAAVERTGGDVATPSTSVPLVRGKRRSSTRSKYGRRRTAAEKVKKDQDSQQLQEVVRPLDDLDLMICHEEFSNLLALANKVKQVHEELLEGPTSQRPSPAAGYKRYQTRQAVAQDYYRNYRPRLANSALAPSEVIAAVERMQEQLSSKHGIVVRRGMYPLTDAMMDDNFSILQEELDFCHKCLKLEKQKQTPGERNRHQQCMFHTPNMPQTPCAVPCYQSQSSQAVVPTGTGTPAKSVLMTPKYTKWQTDILMKWMVGHVSKPFPTSNETAHLAQATGLTKAQVVTWMSNVRTRNSSHSAKKKKPNTLIDFVFLAHQRDQENRKSIRNSSPSKGRSRSDTKKNTRNYPHTKNVARTPKRKTSTIVASTTPSASTTRQPNGTSISGLGDKAVVTPVHSNRTRTTRTSPSMVSHQRNGVEKQVVIGDAPSPCPSRSFESTGKKRPADPCTTSSPVSPPTKVRRTGSCSAVISATRTCSSTNQFDMMFRLDEEVEVPNSNAVKSKDDSVAPEPMTSKRNDMCHGLLNAFADNWLDERSCPDTDRSVDSTRQLHAQKVEKDDEIFLVEEFFDSLDKDALLFPSPDEKGRADGPFGFSLQSLNADEVLQAADIKLEAPTFT